MGQGNYQIIKSLQLLNLPTDLQNSNISTSLRIVLCFMSYLNYIRTKKLWFPFIYAKGYLVS